MSSPVLGCGQLLSVFDSLRPHGLQPVRLLCPWGFSRQEYWNRLPCPSPGDLPNPGIEPRSPTLQADSLPSEPPEKFKNTRVGNLSLLWGTSPPRNQTTEVSCIAGRYFYQLSYQESPIHSDPPRNKINEFVLNFSIFYLFLVSYITLVKASVHVFRFFLPL